MHGALRQLAGGADHLGMAGMADQQNFAAGGELALGLDMHLRDQGASGIQIEEVAGPRRLRHGLRNAMRGEYDRRVGIRDFVQFLDENGALGFEAFHHVAVMDDLMPHIDWGAVFGERKLDDLDGSVDTGAEPARGGEIDRQGRAVGLPSIGLYHAAHWRLGELGLAACSPSLALSRLKTTDSLARQRKATGNSRFFKANLASSRHIRRVGLACQAEDGVR